MSDVFISYSRADLEAAKDLKTLLEDNGFSVWWDANLYGGEAFEKAIEKQLHESKAVIVLWSDSSIKSKFVHAEARVAFEHDRLLPLALDPINIQDLPFTMRGVHVEPIDKWARSRAPEDAHDAIVAIGQMVDTNRTRRDDHKSETTVEIVFFNAITSSDDINDWEAYLKRFPRGRFRDIARNKVQLLSNPGKKASGGGKLKYATLSVLAMALIGGVVTSPLVLETWSWPETSTTPTPAPAPQNDLAQRRQALLDATTAFEGTSFSDAQANTAIRAANNLTSEEIEIDEDLVKALETTLDSFFSAQRFDFVERIEAKHAPLLKRQAEFYVSFCLSYGQRLMSSRAISSTNLWQLDDPARFQADLEKYYEYAKLDVVSQRFPEYAILFEPGILKLQGAPEEQIISRITRTPSLSEADMQNFRNLLETSARALDDPANSPDGVVVLTDRYRDLIANYAGFDPSGQWTRIGILTDVDMTLDEDPAQQ